MAESPTPVNPRRTYLTVDQLLRQLDWCRSEVAPDQAMLVGIGGHGASGKTTLAKVIAKSLGVVQIVSTDEFFDGAMFQLERIVNDVIEPLTHRKRASYTPWLWSEGRLGDQQRTIKPQGVVVIEGVCALHTMMRASYRYRIWVDAPESVRLERGVARDGEQSRERWASTWIPNENAYVASDQPTGCADAFINGLTII